ncbi:MAG TPA: cell wall-binding repeat-containing protein, partial [Kineosporiaceae bacterium]|nr:cell wall-binding repeat-containing protein [Kineosporiaceae bacterium]
VANGRTVVSATRDDELKQRGNPDGEFISWLTRDVVISLLVPEGDLELVPVFGGKVRRYSPGGRANVLDATASPDESKIAVRIGDDGGTDTVTDSIVVVDAKTLTKLTTVMSTTTGQLGRPAWSKDGATVYAPMTVDHETSILAHAADTNAGEPEVVLPHATETPFVYLRPVTTHPGYGARYGGDAVATSVRLSQEIFRTARGSSCAQDGAAVAAVLAKAGSVEAAVGAPLAGHTCGPLLLTGSKTLDSRTAAELKRLLRRGRSVYLVGNTTSLAPAVATAVSRLGFKPVRYAGADVYATAVQVALKGFKDHKTAALASGTQPLAAVVASSTAGASDVPLLLTAGTKMPKGTLAFLDKYRTGAWVVGTQGAKAAPWAYRYAGANDVATAINVGSRYYYPPRTVTLVAPGDVANAYAATGFAALYGSPVLVVGPKALPAADRTYIDQSSASVGAALLFATKRAVTDKVLADALKLSGGQTAQ